MNMRKSWSGAMRRVAEVSKIVAGTGKQIPRFARDDNTNKNAGDNNQDKDARDDNQDKNVRGDNSTQQIEAAGETARRTVPLPSILAPGTPTLLRAGVMPKPTPANLRRFAEMPIARKAINTIKDRVAGMRWRIQPRQGRRHGGSDTSQVSAQKKGASRSTSSGQALGHPDSHISHNRGYVGHPSDDLLNVEEQIAVLTENFEQPNPEDSFRSMIEQVLEDVLVGGFGAIELDLDRKS